MLRLLKQHVTQSPPNFWISLESLPWWRWHSSQLWALQLVHKTLGCRRGWCPSLQTISTSNNHLSRLICLESALKTQKGNITAVLSGCSVSLKPLTASPIYGHIVDNISNGCICALVWEKLKVSVELVFLNQQSKSRVFFNRCLICHSEGNKRRSSVAKFPRLCQVGFLHWAQGQAMMLSTFCVLWFKGICWVIVWNHLL